MRCLAFYQTAYRWLRRGLAAAIILYLLCGALSQVASVQEAMAADGTVDSGQLVRGQAAEIGLSALAISAPQAPQMQLTRWRGGAKAAISLTFDDSSRDHWWRGLQLWDDYGFKVTLGIIGERFMDNPKRLPQLQEAFDRGHELANHTTHHPNLTGLTDKQVRNEIAATQELLLHNVKGLKHVYSLIYPYEMYTPAAMRIAQEMGYVCARSGAQGIVDYAELNDPESPPFFHLYSWANEDLLPQWMWDSTTDWAVEHGGWLIEECHGIGNKGETGTGWSPRPVSEYREHYDHIRSYGSQIWVAPMGEVARYIRERQAAQVADLRFNAGRLSYTLSCPLDSGIYDVPLTMSIELPPSWERLTIEQAGNAVSWQLSADGTLALFDVKPNGGTVQIVCI